MDGTNVLFFICIITFVSAAIPAADSECPIFDFTEPIEQYCLLSVNN